jgi:hypothetical protein
MNQNINELNKLGKDFFGNSYKNLSDKSTESEINNTTRKIAEFISNADKNTNSIVDYINKSLINSTQDNTEVNKKLEFIESGIDANTDTVMKVYDSVNKLNSIFYKLDTHIKSNLVNELEDKNISSCDNNVLTKIVREALWDGPKIGEGNMSLGLHLRDIFKYIMTKFKFDNMNNIYEATRNSLEDIKNELIQKENKYSKEILSLQLILDNKSEDLERSNKQSLEIRQKQSNLNTKITEYEEEVNNLKDAIISLKKEKQAMSNELINVGSNNSSMRENMVLLNNEIAELESRLRNIQKQSNDLKNYKTNSLSKFDILNTENVRLKNQEEIINKQREESSKKRTQQLNENLKKIDELTVALSNMKSERDKLSVENLSKDSFDELKRRLKEMKYNGKLSMQQQAELAQVLWRDIQHSSMTVSNQTPAPQRRQRREQMVVSNQTPAPQRREQMVVSNQTPAPQRRQRRERREQMVVSNQTPAPQKREQMVVSNQTPAPQKREQMVVSNQTPAPQRRQRREQMVVSNQTPAPQRRQRREQMVVSNQTPAPQRREQMVVSNQTPAPQRSQRREQMVVSNQTPAPQRRQRREQMVVSNQTPAPELNIKQLKEKALKTVNNNFNKQKQELEKKRNEAIQEGNYQKAENISDVIETSIVMKQNEENNILNSNKDQIKKIIKKQNKENDTEIKGTPLDILKEKQRRRNNKLE